MVTARELDLAMHAGVLEVTRSNERPVRCALCSTHCPPGWARRLWIDGHKRGFLCLVNCHAGVLADDSRAKRDERRGLQST